MGRVKWDASGGNNLTGMSPFDNPVAYAKDDATDSHFGGQRRKGLPESLGDPKDYTKRTTVRVTAKKENPVDESIKDVDDMTDAFQRKREFSRREETSNVQKSNTAEWREQSDSDRRPPEETDPFEPDPSDPNFLIKNRRSKLKGHIGSGQYDNMPNRGMYEGEIS
jgi:hypothetical protein